MNQHIPVFFKKLPQIQLHAHINGCMRRETLSELLGGINLENKFDTQQEGYKLFDFIHQALTSIDTFKRVTKEVLQDFQNDNVVYLELRTTPQNKLGKFSKKNYMQEIIATMSDFNNKNQYDSRLIFSIDKSQKLKQGEENCNLYLELSQKYPDIVLGLDFSGNPETNLKFQDYQEIFQEAQKHQIPMTFHTGDCSYNPVDMEWTQNCIEFLPNRIGHFIYFDDQLANFVIQNQIPIQMCLSSNFSQFFVTRMKQHSDHHMGYFYSQNHPFSLCTDDTLLFSNSSSLEYYLSSQAFNWGVKDMKKILHNSANSIFDTKQIPELKQKVDAFLDTSKQDITY